MTGIVPPYTLSVTVAIHGFEYDFKSSFETPGTLQLELKFFAALSGVEHLYRHLDAGTLYDGFHQRQIAVLPEGEVAADISRTALVGIFRRGRRQIVDRKVMGVAERKCDSVPEVTDIS